MSKNIAPFVGNSNFVNEIKSLLPTLSSNNASVLLVGERGSGKRLIAQHIHYETARNFGCFFEVNCKSFTEFQILESFDTVEKLVTYNQRVTLFISFIDELSPAAQEKLLSLVKLHANKGAGIKLITSTEVSLEACVSAEKFSSDLFYRLNAVVLNVIPLRQRKEDILPIAKSCMESFSKKSGYGFNQFSEEAISALENNFWGGNIDELFNAIQRAFIVGQPPVIKSSDLGFNNMDSAIRNVTEVELADRSLKNALDAFKKEYLTKILEENGWNQTKTARVLGIQRTYVIRLMNELQIRRK
ncbi:MAG: sigma-54-dependent Fis family transcriptional regulator [Treponema sp.]|nr:sigma-54-dependent Fis family transcriptional regulator [Treponema sp.]